MGARLARLLYGGALLYALSVLLDARAGLSPDLSSRGLWRRYESPRPDGEAPDGEVLLIDARPAPLAAELRARFAEPFAEPCAEPDLSTPARAAAALRAPGALTAWRGEARALPEGAEVALVWVGEGAGAAPRLVVARYDGRWVWVSPDGVRLGPTPLSWEGRPALPLPALRGARW